MIVSLQTAPAATTMLSHMENQHAAKGRAALQAAPKHALAQKVSCEYLLPRKVWAFR